MALIFRATIKPFNFDDFENRVLKSYADEVKRELENRTPGKAAKVWKISGPESSHITLSNDTAYLPFLERGTGLYGPGHTLIKPKTASILTWIEGSRRIFAKSTKGMKPQPFIKNAVQAGMLAGREVINGNA